MCTELWLYLFESYTLTAAWVKFIAPWSLSDRLKFIISHLTHLTYISSLPSHHYSGHSLRFKVGRGVGLHFILRAFPWMCCFVPNSVRDWEKQRKMVALRPYVTVSTTVFEVVRCVAGPQILVLLMASHLSSMRSITMWGPHTTQGPHMGDTLWLDILFLSWILYLNYTSCFTIMQKTLEQSTKIMTHTPWTPGDSCICVPALNLFSIALIDLTDKSPCN